MHTYDRMETISSTSDTEELEEKCLNYEQSKEDRISQLPDDILIHILSLLPLKDSGKTSVVSTRWKTLWMHVPNLYFENLNSLNRMLLKPKRKILRRERLKFVDWVDSILHLHKTENWSLDELRIWFQMNKDFKKHINSWVRYAFARRVKRLELRLSIGKPMHDTCHCTFPKDHLLNLGNTCALRELALYGVGVTDEVFQLFLLQCPLLERLYIFDSIELLNPVVSGSSLKLKHLEIDFSKKIKCLTISDCSLESLRICYMGGLSITNVPTLAEAKFIASYTQLPMFSLLSSSLSRLEVLTLDTYKPVDLKKTVELNGGVPKLSKLKELIINLATDEGIVGVVPSFLQSCPILRKFALRISGAGKCPETERLQPAGKMSNSCLHQRLEVIKILGYRGCANEVELITFFIENAIPLKNIIVDLRNPWLEKVWTLDEEQGARIRMEQLEGFGSLEDFVVKGLDSQVRARQQLEGIIPKHINLRIL